MNTEEHKQHMTAKQRKMREIEEDLRKYDTGFHVAAKWTFLLAAVIFAVLVVIYTTFGNGCVGADKCGGVTCPEGTAPLTVQADNGWTCICSVVPK